jgi:hypothetical protein
MTKPELTDCLDAEWGGQQAEGERDGQIDHLKDPVNGDADNAEREQQKPNQRIRNQGQERERPAKYKQKAPKQECKHGGDLLLTYTRGARRMFRAVEIRTPQDLLYKVGFGVGVGLAIDGKFPGEAAFQSGVVFGTSGVRAQVVAKGDVAEKLRIGC